VIFEDGGWDKLNDTHMCLSVLGITQQVGQSVKVKGHTD